MHARLIFVFATILIFTTYTSTAVAAGATDHPDIRSAPSGDEAAPAEPAWDFGDLESLEADPSGDASSCQATSVVSAGGDERCASEPAFMGDLELQQLLNDSAQRTSRWWRFSNELSTQLRTFPATAVQSDQNNHLNTSFAVQPRLELTGMGGDLAFTAELFARFDLDDSRRTHWDIREANVSWRLGEFELRAGIGKVFWGVAESVHLVDVINQSDTLEGIDGEDKLGQPMLAATWYQETAGELSVYLLPYSRERRFPGNAGRLRGPVVVSHNHSTHASGAGAWHPSLALRWWKNVGPWDLGASYFYGTSREPQLRVSPGHSGGVRLAPHYDVVHQGGADVQLTVGGWLLKGEAIVRGNQGPLFGAAVAGFEYTLSNIGDSGIDVGLLGEFSYDGRENQAPALFDHDAFGGVRIAFNNLDATQLLTGALVDVVNGATVFSLEASSRLGDHFKLGAEMRMFLNTRDDETLSGFGQDSYGLVELTWLFQS